VLATVFGTLLGALICFMRMSKRHCSACPARAYIAVLRGTPVLVLLMLVFYVVFASVNISPLIVGHHRLGMNFGAYVAEDLPDGHRGSGPGADRGGPRHGLHEAPDLPLHRPAADGAEDPGRSYQGRVHLAGEDDVDRRLHRPCRTSRRPATSSGAAPSTRSFPLVMIAILYFAIAWLLMLGLDHLERVTDPKWRRRKAGRHD